MSKSNERFEIVCATCGATDTVPFQPRPGSKLTCRACFKKDSPDNARSARPERRGPQGDRGGRSDGPRGERRGDGPRGERRFDGPRSERRFDGERGGRPDGERGGRGERRFEGDRGGRGDGPRGDGPRGDGERRFDGERGGRPDGERGGRSLGGRQDGARRGAGRHGQERRFEGERGGRPDGERGGRGEGRGQDRRGGGGGKRPGPSRPTWTITCSECGAQDTVPFEPRAGSEVLCGDCHGSVREKKDRQQNYREQSLDRRGASTGGKHIPRLDHGTRVSYPITCEECGKNEFLSYVPKTSGAILCTGCSERKFGSNWSKVKRRADEMTPMGSPGRPKRRVEEFTPNPERLEDFDQLNDLVKVRKS